MNELFVATQVVVSKGLAIALAVVVVLLLIAICAMNKQTSKMIEVHKRELERQERKYQGLLDDKSSAIRELLAQKRELEEKCKNYKEQRDFLMEGKKKKDEEPQVDFGKVNASQSDR